MLEAKDTSVTEAILDCGLLILSDDKSALGEYHDLFSREGYRVSCESNVRLALHRLATSDDIAVVFVDLKATGTLTSFEKFRSQEKLRDSVEYIVVTGERSEPSPPGESGKAFENTEYLVKPFSNARALAAIESAYNVARMQRFRLSEMRSFEISLLEFRSRTLASVSQLVALAQEAQGRFASPNSAAALSPDCLQTTLRPFVEEECRRARLRNKIFGSGTLNYSGWILLLVLAEAKIAGIELTVKSAAYTANLPISSALRKINEMCAGALIKKREDPKDARRSFVTLTTEGASCLADYLFKIAEGLKN